MDTTPPDSSPGQPLAYRGKEGCRSVICTRNPSVSDRCYGWHCGTCDEPTSFQGHDCPQVTS